MSLTNVAKKYNISRASVVRFVRLAQQQQQGCPYTTASSQQQQVVAVA
jgi:hypothetical protein